MLFLLLLGCNENQSEKKAVPIVSNIWLGKRSTLNRQNKSVLEMTEIKNDSIKFSLFASSGANTGELDGFAIVNQTTATFLDISEGDTCLITFKLRSDSSISVLQKLGTCFAGMGVYYTGEYINNEKIPKNPKSVSLMDLDVFVNKSQDSIFRNLVGADYALFVNSTQLSKEVDDLDSLNAYVQSAGVRGLFTIMENIIMIDSANNIWAAVIDNNKVYYYTNATIFKDKLPKTIEIWRERFKENEVVFK